MLNNMQDFISADKSDKAMRWLCWAQGVLWSTGLITLDQCRNDIYR